mgnify:CR=1 FL=1
MSKFMFKKTKTDTAYEPQKEQLNMEKNDLVKKYSELEAQYEEKRLAVLVVEAKLMFDQGSAEARLAEMC